MPNPVNPVNIQRPPPRYVRLGKLWHLTRNAPALLASGWDAECSQNTTYGHGLAFSVQPEAWKEIARLGGCDTVEIRLPAGSKILDLYRTFKAIHPDEIPAVRAWAIANGNAIATKVFHVYSTDDDGEERYMVFETRAEAENELGAMEDGEIEGDDGRIEEVDGLKYKGRSGGSQHDLLRAYVAAQYPEVAAVWYADDLDVSALSAPQGYVVPGKERQVQIIPPRTVQAMAFGGEGAEKKPKGLAKAKQMLQDKQPMRDVWELTGWHMGADGKWRFEIDDTKFFVNPTDDWATNAYDFGVPLERVVRHDKLFQNYPWLKSVQVEVHEFDTAWRQDLNTIFIGLDVLKKPHELRSSLLHEIQHAIQHREGMDAGASVLDENYATAPGEVEAVDVENRQYWSNVKRHKLPPQKVTASNNLRLYTSGYCAEFAVALHRLYGWPMGVFYDTDKEDGEQYTTLAHAFAIHPSGSIVDCNGLQDKSSVRDNTLVGIGHFITEASATEESLEQESMEGLNPYVIKKATAWIRKNPDRYGGQPQKIASSQPPENPFLPPPDSDESRYGRQTRDETKTAETENWYQLAVKGSVLSSEE